jgi:hypothetical protein
MFILPTYRILAISSHRGPHASNQQLNARETSPGELTQCFWRLWWWFEIPQTFASVDGARTILVVVRPPHCNFPLVVRVQRHSRRLLQVLPAVPQFIRPHITRRLFARLTSLTRGIYIFTIMNAERFHRWMVAERIQFQARCSDLHSPIKCTWLYHATSIIRPVRERGIKRNMDSSAHLVKFSGYA